MMGAANEMPNPSLKWQDLAIQKLNCHRNSIFGETKKKFGISTQEPGRIASFPNTLLGMGPIDCRKARPMTQKTMVFRNHGFPKIHSIFVL